MKYIQTYETQLHKYQIDDLVILAGEGWHVNTCVKIDCNFLDQ